MKRAAVVLVVLVVLVAVAADGKAQAIVRELGEDATEGVRNVVARHRAKVWRWAASAIGLIVALGLFLPLGAAAWAAAAVLGISALGRFTDLWGALEALGLLRPGLIPSWLRRGRQVSGAGECEPGSDGQWYVDDSGVVKGCVNT